MEDDVVEIGNSPASCTCPTSLIAQAKSVAVFTDLDPNEAHFAMVSWAEGVAFFGLPPTSIRPPKIVDAIISSSSNRFDYGK